MRMKIYNKETEKVENIKVIPKNEFLSRLVKKLNDWGFKSDIDFLADYSELSNVIDKIPTLYISKSAFSKIKKYFKENYKKPLFNKDFLYFIINTLEEEKRENNFYYPYYTSSNLISKVSRYYKMLRYQIPKSDYEKVLNRSYKEYKEKLYNTTNRVKKPKTSKITEVKFYKVDGKLFDSYNKALNYAHKQIAHAYNFSDDVFYDKKPEKTDSIYIQVYFGIDENIKDLSIYPKNKFELYLNKTKIIKFVNVPNNLSRKDFNNILSNFENFIIYEREYENYNDYPIFKLKLINHDFNIKEDIIEIDYNQILMPIKLKKVIKKMEIERG